MFIPKQAVYLFSSIAHYERWFLMRADFVAVPHDIVCCPFCQVSFDAEFPSTQSA
jgi:hypothetical protein